MKYEISEDLIDFIAKFEGFRAEKYICPGGASTIGYGHSLLKDESFEVITKEEALEILKKDINIAIKSINYNITNPNLTEKQYMALTSFVFNLGVGAFSRSNLLKKINDNQLDEAVKEFAKYNKTKGVELKILTKRRAEEAALFAENLSIY